jgi:hypothetical protein
LMDRDAWWATSESQDLDSFARPPRASGTIGRDEAAGLGPSRPGDHRGALGASGVWVVREAAREALRNPPRKFETLETALADMATRIRTPARDWRPHSELARGVGQTTLAKFFLGGRW